jgi:hypothetical protein
MQITSQQDSNTDEQALVSRFRQKWYAKHNIEPTFLLTNEDDMQAYIDDWKEYRSRIKQKTHGNN